MLCHTACDDKFLPLSILILAKCRERGRTLKQNIHEPMKNISTRKVYFLKEKYYVFILQNLEFIQIWCDPTCRKTKCDACVERLSVRSRNFWTQHYVNQCVWSAVKPSCSNAEKHDSCKKKKKLWQLDSWLMRNTPRGVAILMTYLAIGEERCPQME